MAPWSLSLVAVLCMAVLAVPLLPVPEVLPLSWGAFLGRLHPLVVHFPIVLVLLPVLLEGLVWATKQEALRTVVPWLWGLAAVSSLVSVGAGYLLYASGDYGGDLVERHLWSGVLVTLLILVTAYVAWRAPLRTSRGWFGAYAGLLLVTNGVLVVTAHLGGSLTHGEEFLTDAFPRFGVAPLDLEETPPESLRVFQDLLMPAFERRCQSCHNPNKTKGDLLLTSFVELSRGGESGRPMLVPEDPPAGELLRRVTLPPTDDDAMPPDGKPPLQEDEVDLLHAWIAAGADPELRLGDLPDADAQALVDRYLPRLIVAERRLRRDQAERDALLAELRQRVEPRGLVVAPDPEADSMLFAVSMRMPPVPVGDDALAALQPFAASLSRLSLVGSDVTDDGLYHVGRMRNLRALFLQRTGLDGSGLVYLAELPGLAVLGLSQTALTDPHALYLLQMPALEEVYLYATDVSDTLRTAMQAYRPAVQFQPVEGPYY